MRKLRTVQEVTVAELAFGILSNDFHYPLIDGKANCDVIEDAITIGMMRHELGYISAETVKLSIAVVNELILQHNVK
jgi:hypothetical protein